MSLRPSSRGLILILASFLLVSASGAVAGPNRRPDDRSQTEERKTRGGKPGLTPVRPDALTRSLKQGNLSKAEYALERARSLFDLGDVRARYGDVARPDGHLVTFILRDLSLRKSALEGKKRRQAERIFLRPDSGQGDNLNGFIVNYSVPNETRCSADPAITLCFHWVTSTADKASPEEVQAAEDVFTQVWNTEITSFGFRPPEGDATSKNAGPNGHTDIYLANLGPNYYGYCTSDDPNVDRIFNGSYDYADVSAYCVVDNDFEEFPQNSPLDNLRVTAAHEFLHAIQFAYDYLEDFWMLEGTATAIEDFVYDDINDNLQYLEASPLRRPRLPLDFTGVFSIDPAVYGTWTWWRFLAEQFSLTGAPDPSVIREIIARAESSKESGITIEKSRYSTQAVKDALAARGTNIKTVFALYGAANYQASEFYEEGATYDAFLGSRRVRKAAISPAAPLKKGETRVDHLSNLWKVYVPGDGVAADALLKLTLNLPARRRGSAASVRIFRTDGTNEIQSFVLSKDGSGTLSVPFGAGTIEKVLLVLTNASTRTDCFSREARYVSACYGKPRDDRLTYIFKARLI